MENLFLYGASGDDLEQCQSFLHGLQDQVRPRDAPPNTNSGIYIPSPQAMLHTGIDPFAPPDNFDQMFVIDQNQWEYPSRGDLDVHGALATGADRSTPVAAEGAANGPLGGLVAPALPGPSPSTSPSTHLGSGPGSGPGAPWRAHRSLPSPPIKSESDSSPHEDEYHDHRDIGVQSSGISKRQPRQRKTKTSHNMIEKRYRNNINDKINLLRDSIPTLREAASTPLVDGIPSVRLNKATVLTKAAEYIEQLKNRNRSLQKENTELRARVAHEHPAAPVHAPVHAPGHPAGHAPGHAPAPAPASAPAHDFYRTHNSHSPYQQPQQPQPQGNTKFALGCATAGFFTTGSVLSSGDGSFRGLSVLPLPALLRLIGHPSSSTLRLVAVAAVCFLIGGLYVSLLSQWSASQSPKQRHTGDLRARADALARLGLPERPSVTSSLLKVILTAPAALFCLTLGTQSYEYLKQQLGCSSEPNIGYYLDKIVEEELLSYTGSGRPVPTLQSLALFLMSFTSHTPNRNMLQAIQLKQLAAKVHATQLLNPLIDRLWMRGDAKLPGTIQNLAKIPLSEISDGKNTHIAIDARGVLVSKFLLNQTEDSQVLGLLDLIAYKHAYKLQDQCIRKRLNTLVADYDLLEQSATISTPGTVSYSRYFLLRAVFARNLEDLDAVLSEVAQSSLLHHLHPLIPHCFACALTIWFAQRPETSELAESLLTEFMEPLAEFRSASIFCAYYLAFRALYRQGRGRSNLIQPVLGIRTWLGSADAAAFGLTEARRKELISETLEFAKSFASRPSDEACDLASERGASELAGGELGTWA